MSRVDQAKTTWRYRPGEMVCEEGQPLAGPRCIAAGLLLLHKRQPNGQSAAMHLAQAGRTFGFRDLVSNARTSLSAIALSTATVCTIPRRVVRLLLSDQPRLEQAVQRRIAADAERTERMLVRLAACTLEERLAQQLLELLPDFGHVGPAGEAVLRLPVNWRSLSALVWSRPETVSRALRALAERGIVAQRGITVTIRDLERLRALAQQQ